MILLIDDCKEGGWADIVARNAVAGAIVLRELFGHITELHIDFDLGSSSINADGLSVLRNAFLENLLPNLIWIVSLNPVGRKQMADFLVDNGYKQTGRKFEKGNDGMFNSWDYDEKEAETDATRRAKLVKKFLESDETHLLVLDSNEKHGGSPHLCHLKSRNEREDCADCIWPERKCSECINKARKENKNG